VVVLGSGDELERDLFLNLPNTDPLRLGGLLPPLLLSLLTGCSSSTVGSMVSGVSSTISFGSISLSVGGSSVVVVVVAEALVDSDLPLPLLRELNLAESLDGRFLLLRRGADGVDVVDVGSTLTVLSTAIEASSCSGEGEGSAVGATVVRLREFLKRVFSLPLPKLPLLDGVVFAEVGGRVVVVVVGSATASGNVAFATSSISVISGITSSMGFLGSFFCFRPRVSLLKSLPLLLDAAVVAAAVGRSVVLGSAFVRLLKLGLGLLNLLGRLPRVVLGAVVVVVVMLSVVVTLEGVSLSD